MAAPVRLHLIDYADSTDCFLRCDDIAPTVSASWGKDYFLEACQRVGARDDFFPLALRYWNSEAVVS
jgi:hypothetical protein